MRFGTLRSPLGLFVYLAGMICLYVGERLAGAESGWRFGLSGFGVLAMLTATGFYLTATMRTADTNRRVERLAFFLAFLGLVAIAVHFLASDLVLGPRPVRRGADEGPMLRDVAQVVFLVMLICSFTPLVFLQWSLGSMARGRGVEFGRVRASVTAGASLAMLLCSLFLINAVASRKDVSVDFTYFKTTSPSQSTRELIQGLDQDVLALLFFPKGSDVLAEVEPYFRELSGLSAKFKVREADRALEPELAEKYRVSRDGVIVLVRGGSNKSLDLGDALEAAQRNLRKLDGEFQTTFLKLRFERETIYLVTGHGERTDQKVEGDIRGRISLIKGKLEAANFTVKNLEAGSGLADRVPEDAAMLLWVGPTAALFPGEAGVIEAYLKTGGRMLLLLDPESERQPVEVLDFLGLVLHPTKLIGPYALRYSNTDADRYNLITNQFSNHGATGNIMNRDLPVAMPTVGALDRKADAPPDDRITFLVRSLPNTFADENGNLQHDEKEAQKIFELGAAVTRKAEEKGEEKEKVEEKDQPSEPTPAEGKAERPKDESEMRVVVLADADVFSDIFFAYAGNSRLLSGVVSWLIDPERVGGVTTSEEDVPIQHTQSEDLWWFYSTVFAVPFAVLVLGAITRWGRGRKRRTR